MKSVRPAEGPIRVLHVDDDEAFLRLTETSVSEIDPALQFRQTTDPTAVLDRLEDDGIECVVSDYRMPQLTGVELLERVREHDSDLPFVLFTGQGSETVASEAISAGVTDYVSKGGGLEGFELLANRVRGAVEQRRLEQSLVATREGYEKLLEAAPDAILVVDAETGVLLEVNTAAEELFGRPREELEGLHQTELHPEDDREYYRDVFEEHAGSSGVIRDKRELSVLHAEGHEIPVEINATTLELGDQRLVQGIFRDLRGRE
ncbi:chemotaxis response regulator protein-glutamate methylesterase [Halalkalicoccus paucihalophilus]|uniref:Chemotaxis response regulator protein-glutamate methylesterase n=1 Tax=Halalkalicoccus paucihalophilus TaxID=1008153 RepID=A0A151AGL5_9EURY|nr:PAS domain S-box protein [Halalkalicoccus paucihalophilus]KYH26809.1 chemotaxis response regulator protein-glutamate methylesterase [Halalkalicoccus paucihalophilus]